MFFYILTLYFSHLQGDKIRRRNDWMKWIMPAATTAQYSNPSSPQAGLVSQLQGLQLQEATSESQEAGFEHATGA